MKHRFFLLILICFTYIGSTAQQNRFVYIQTESKQPFYIRINNVILSSSASGYLIIPKLKDGMYPLSIGFPKNQWPVQSLSVRVNNKDAGYTLKNFGKGWGLVNLQTQEIIMGTGTEAVIINTSENDDDTFTQMLADVVNSPELKKKPVGVPVEVAVKKTEDPAIAATKIIETKKETKPAGVRTLLNETNDKGRQLVYIDEAENDTIRIFIPVNEKTGIVLSKPKEKEVKSNEKFIDIELQNPNAKDTVVKVSTAKEEAPPVKNQSVAQTMTMINSDCRANATGDDFMKLRKKMAAAGNNDQMVSVAKKAFKVKCYSTTDIKNLSVLFLDDAGRYQFFDTAYPFVYDSGNFATLQQQLSDPYFITRFQAMIHR